MARQKKYESLQHFADRCRSLAQKTTPQVEDPATQRLYYEQAERMLLVRFTSGFLGTKGRQEGYAIPKTMDEALKIAITVNQAEIQEQRNEAFYVDEARGSGPADRPTRGTRFNGIVRNATQHAETSRTQIQKIKGLYRRSGNGNDRKCYERTGAGYFARECPTRQHRMNPENAPTNRIGNTPKRSAGTHNQEASRRFKGRKNDPAEGKRVGNGSRDSSFHITVPKNDIDYFVARVKLKAAAPNILATISGLHRAFLL